MVSRLRPRPAPNVLKDRPYPLNGHPDISIAPSTGLAMSVRELGVMYNLRFTKKTRLRTSFVNMLPPRSRRQDVLGAAQRLVRAARAASRWA